MSEYVSVPVPHYLVPEVMDLIVQRQAGSAHRIAEANPSQSPEERGDDAGQPESRIWTEGEFARLARTAEKASGDRLPSVRKFVAVLSMLAESAPSGMSIEELGRELGTTGLQLQNSLGPFTRWMRNNISADVRWPIIFVAGKWTMPEENVSRWQEARRLVTSEASRQSTTLEDGAK